VDQGRRHGRRQALLDRLPQAIQKAMSLASSSRLTPSAAVTRDIAADSPFARARAREIGGGAELLQHAQPGLQLDDEIAQALALTVVFDPL
jgi:hypothetical protein